MDGQIIQATTSDGVVTAHLFCPADARTGVIMYMDAFGPRPALFQMAARIAGWGHAVLVPDLFYRLAPYGPFDAKTAFANDTTRVQLRGLMTATTHARTEADGATFLNLLTGAGVTGPVATVGYCMGGAKAIIAAAACPDRIVAAASFHGGNLASDQPDSPHLRLGSIKGRVYVGSAAVDSSFSPEQSTLMAQALRAAELDHQMENYKGMVHGWTVPDSAAFNQSGAERHWQRLQVFLTETLLG